MNKAGNVLNKIIIDCFSYTLIKIPKQLRYFLDKTVNSLTALVINDYVKYHYY